VSFETTLEKGVPMSAQPSDTPVLDLLTGMTAQSLEASTLDPKDLALVRLAALVAVDAPPASYFANLSADAELGIDADQVRGVLTAVAPIVGTTRVVSATGKIIRALGVAIEALDAAAEESAGA
jgi:4-carboxymuconolactone decarboxylase